MNKTLLRIAARRERIVAQAAVQRQTLSRHVEPWRMPLAVADKAITAVQYLKRHPGGIVGITVLLVALRPRRIVTWLERGWISWQLLQSLRSK